MSQRERWDRTLVALERARSAGDRIRAATELSLLAEQDPSCRAEVPALIPRLLGDQQEELRRGGVRLAALVLPHDEAVAILLHHLADPSEKVRMEAAGQLADLADPAQRGALAAALQDAAFSVRFEAARGMAALGHPAGLEVLIEALGMGELRFRALGALGELGDPRALEPVQKVFRRLLLNAFERTSAAAVLAKLGDAEGAKYLVERTRARRAQDRRMAVEMCGEVQPPGGLERVREILADRADPARGAAARALGRARPEDAEAVLAALLEEPGADEELLLDLAEGLLWIGTDSARERARAVEARLRSEDARAELRAMVEEVAP